MRTGHFPGKTTVLLGLGLLLAVASLPAQTSGLALPSPIRAQPQRLGIIGVGPFGRLGSLPQAFQQGIPVALEATVQWPIYRALQLATSADLTVQRIGTVSSLSSADLTVNRIIHRPYSFDVVHFGLGPAFSLASTHRLRVSGSVQAMALIPSWGSSAVGTCPGGNCSLLGPSASDQQTEFHMGAAGRLRFNFGSRKERLGFELLGIVAPRHGGSHIPLSSLALMVVVGAS